MKLNSKCGVTVTVEQRLWNQQDAFGNDIEAYGDPISVDNVLVDPEAAAMLNESRPEGVRIAHVLHFPKTWVDDLRGAKVTLTGRYSGTYKVIGVPQPLMEELTPWLWNMTVKVEAIDG